MKKNHKILFPYSLKRVLWKGFLRINSKYKIIYVIYKFIYICVIPQAQCKLQFGIKLNIQGSDKSHTKAKSKTCKVHDVTEILRLLGDKFSQFSLFLNSSKTSTFDFLFLKIVKQLFIFL